MDLKFDRILSIGINYVGTRSELNGCINDVINVQKHCQGKSVVKMTELDSSELLVPTAANILRQIDAFVRGVKPGERLLFQYSGHGSYQRDSNGDETDRRDEVICPVDYSRAGCISDDLLKKRLVDPLPAGCKLLCIFDCCHSGTILDLRYNYVVYPRGNKRKYVTKKDPKASGSSCDVVCFSGCMDPQTSADAYIAGKYQGAMTWGLLSVIRDLKKKKKKVSYHNVMKGLVWIMKRKRYRQVPQISTGGALNLNAEMS